jgi:hypothetical protein
MEDAFLGRLMGTAYGMALYPSQRHLDVLSRFVTQTHQDVTARWIDQLMWKLACCLELQHMKDLLKSKLVLWHRIQELRDNVPLLTQDGSACSPYLDGGRQQVVTLIGRSLYNAGPGPSGN